VPVKKPGNETAAEAKESGKAAEKAAEASEEAEDTGEEEDATPQDAKAEVRPFTHLLNSNDTFSLIQLHHATYLHQQEARIVHGFQVCSCDQTALLAGLRVS